jgi:hypothetical protein
MPSSPAPTEFSRDPFRDVVFALATVTEAAADLD